MSEFRRSTKEEMEQYIEECKSLRNELDDILEMAKPLEEYKELVEKLKYRIGEFKYKAKKVAEQGKKDGIMCNSNCPESDVCSFGKCPQMKDNLSSLFWGNRSVNTIKNIIGNVSDYYTEYYAQTVEKENK